MHRTTSRFSCPAWTFVWRTSFDSMFGRVWQFTRERRLSDGSSLRGTCVTKSVPGNGTRMWSGKLQQARRPSSRAPRGWTCRRCRWVHRVDSSSAWVRCVHGRVLHPSRFDPLRLLPSDARLTSTDGRMHAGKESHVARASFAVGVHDTTSDIEGPSNDRKDSPFSRSLNVDLPRGRVWPSSPVRAGKTPPLSWASPPRNGWKVGLVPTRTSPPSGPEGRDRSRCVPTVPPFFRGRIGRVERPRPGIHGRGFLGRPVLCGARTEYLPISPPPSSAVLVSHAANSARLAFSHETHLPIPAAPLSPRPGHGASLASVHARLRPSLLPSSPPNVRGWTCVDEDGVRSWTVHRRALSARKERAC